MLVAFGLALVQCQTEKKEPAENAPVQLLSEELQFYPLTEIDSVYSIAIKVHSADSAVVKYKVNLTQELKTFTDSLILDIAAGEDVTGQIIFPNCRVKNRKRPSFTSKLTVIEN